MDVSIVVLTWEDSELTTSCVKSLPTDAEIIVVDNGSADQVGAALRELCEATGARYVRSEANVGYARGMNLGVRHCTRGTVILANNDVVATEGAVAALVAALTDPQVGAAFPVVRDRAGGDHTEAGRYLTARIGLAHAIGLDLVVPGLRICATPERADWLSGPFVALRRTTLERIGGVDESAFFYSEDLRLCHAVQRLGLRIAVVPEAAIVHERETSARRVWSQAEIARRQTREFVRANRELGGHLGRLAGVAYAVGSLARVVVAPGAIRRAVARGAIEGCRGR